MIVNHTQQIERKCNTLKCKCIGGYVQAHYSNAFFILSLTIVFPISIVEVMPMCLFSELSFRKPCSYPEIILLLEKMCFFFERRSGADTRDGERL